MENLKENGLLPRLGLLLVLVALLGLAPRPHQTSLYLSRARWAIQAEAPGKAARSLAEAARRSPERSDLWALAGRYALEAGEPHLAIAYLSPLPHHSLTIEDQLTLADAYEQTGDLPTAILVWQEILSTTDTREYTLAIYERLYTAHRLLKDYPAAIRDLEAITSRETGDAQLHYQLGLLLAAQEPELALVPLLQAADLDPNLRPSANLLRRNIIAARTVEEPAYSLIASGQVLGSLNEWELAAEAFTQASRARPDYAEAWAYLGEALQHLPGDKGGLAELETALALNPESIAAHTFLGLYWLRQGNYDRALESLQEAAVLDPENPILHTEVGSTLALLGDLQTALEAYRHAISIAPYDPTYQRLLAGFSLKYGVEVRSLALPAARQAVILAPNDPANLDMMALVLLKLDDELSAERFLKRALQVDPNYAPAHLHLGMLHLLRGADHHARQEFLLVSALAPDSPAAEHSQHLLQNYFP